MITTKLYDRLVANMGKVDADNLLASCNDADELFEQLNCEIGEGLTKLADNENLTQYNGFVTIETI